MAMSITAGVRRRAALLVAAAAVAASFAWPGLASADSAPTSVKLSENATFISRTQIDIPVALSCTAGQGYWVSVSVVQPQGFGWTTFGGGNTNGQCTGQQQKLVVSVYPFDYTSPWTLGDASATVQACSWSSCASDTKQIHIGT
jgi:hypothetical protein